MHPSRFGELLRQLRKGHGAKSSVVATILNIEDNYLWMLETGRRLPGLELLMRMAELYDCNESWLFENYLTSCLIRETKILHKNFERLVNKEYGLKLPASKPIKIAMGRQLRPGWSDVLVREN